VAQPDVTPRWRHAPCTDAGQLHARTADPLSTVARMGHRVSAVCVRMTSLLRVLLVLTSRSFFFLLRNVNGLFADTHCVHGQTAAAACDGCVCVCVQRCRNSCARTATVCACCCLGSVTCAVCSTALRVPPACQSAARCVPCGVATTLQPPTAPCVHATRFAARLC
jgi:hypothetical protein